MELIVSYNAPGAKPWPGEDLKKEMKGSDFAGLLSTLQMETMLHGGRMDVGLGNSDNMMSIYGQIKKGDEGIEDQKIMAKAFADGIRKSLDTMSGYYKKLYGDALKDFDNNGYVMPMRGRLL